MDEPVAIEEYPCSKFEFVGSKVDFAAGEESKVACECLAESLDIFDVFGSNFVLVAGENVECVSGDES